MGADKEPCSLRLCCKAVVMLVCVVLLFAGGINIWQSLGLVSAAQSKLDALSPHLSSFEPIDGGCNVTLTSESAYSYNYCKTCNNPRYFVRQGTMYVYRVTVVADGTTVQSEPLFSSAGGNPLLDSHADPDAVVPCWKPKGDPAALLHAEPDPVFEGPKNLPPVPFEDRDGVYCGNTPCIKACRDPYPGTANCALGARSAVADRGTGCHCALSPRTVLPMCGERRRSSGACLQPYRCQRHPTAPRPSLGMSRVPRTPLLPASLPCCAQVSDPNAELTALKASLATAKAEDSSGTGFAMVGAVVLLAAALFSPHCCPETLRKAGIDPDRCGGCGGSSDSGSDSDERSRVSQAPPKSGRDMSCAWDEMEADTQANWVALGWTKHGWDNQIKPDTEEMDWDELSASQQKAAAALGFTQEEWDD